MKLVTEIFNVKQLHNIAQNEVTPVMCTTDHFYENS